jgi:hypothetical protein
LQVFKSGLVGLKNEANLLFAKAERILGSLDNHPMNNSILGTAKKYGVILRGG